MRALNLDKEILSTLYLDQHMSIPDIASTLEIGRTSVQRWLKKFNIPIRARFSTDAHTKGLYTGYCTICSKDTSKEYEHKTICKSCSDRKSRLKHRTKRLQKAKEYRIKNREKVYAATAAWVKLHHEKTLEYKRINKGKRRAAIAKGNLTINEWHTILKKQNHICAYCKQYCQNLTLEHIVPLSRGGIHTKSNVCGVCLSCNIKKNDKLLNEWHDYLNEKSAIESGESNR